MSSPHQRELARILALPVVGQPTQEWVDAWSQQVAPKSAWDDPMFKGYFPEQCAAISAYAHYGRLFAMVGAGRGKTLIAYWCASIAMFQHGHRRVLILVPSNVYQEFLTRGTVEAQRKAGVSLPMIPLKNKTARQRMAMVDQYPQGGVFLMPYSYLSQPDGEDLLRKIAPTCLIADEAHRLKNVRAAGPRRLWSVFSEIAKTGVRTDALLLSGTMTTKGVSDYWHMARNALRDLSHVPTTEAVAKDWGVFLDAAAEDRAYVCDELMPLFEWGRAMDQSAPMPYSTVGLRRAYQFRKAATPGVVTSSGDVVPCSLVVDLPQGNTPSAECLAKLDDVEHLAIAPNGEEIEFGLHTYKWNYELASGFYNDLYWDEERWEADQLERAKAHFEDNRSYTKALRTWLENNAKAGLDSPLLVARNMSQHGPRDVGHGLFILWQKQHEQRWKGMPERTPRPVWVSDHRINDVVRWAQDRSKQGGLIWCYHNEFRARQVGSLRKAGLEVVDCPSGHSERLESRRKGVFYVLMLQGYREGLNLQWGDQACMAQWPRSAMVAEQSIARQHRAGQQSDECSVTSFLNCEFDDINFCATLVDSAYIGQVTGSRQRLLIAGYNPAPIIYPLAFLAERVPDVRAIPRELHQELLGRFTPSRLTQN